METQIDRLTLFYSVDCTSKFTKKLNRDILNLLNKPEIPSTCRFPLTNPHNAPLVGYRASIEP